MATAKQVYDHVTDQRNIARLARRELQQWLAAHPEPTSGELAVVVNDIIEYYGQMSADTAVGWYDMLRRLAPITEPYSPTPAAPQTSDAALRAVDWALGGPIGKILDRLVPEVQKIVRQWGRDTVTQNAQRDPARVRFARMPIGDTCAWCLMLASRGAVYHSRTDAGDLDAYHAKCDCQVVPVFAGQEPPYDVQALDDIYRRAAESAGSSRPEDILAAIRRDPAAGVTDAVDPSVRGGPGADPNGAPESAASRAGESKAAIARRNLPILEDTLRQLLTDGQGEETRPVQYHREMIAKYRQYIADDGLVRLDDETRDWQASLSDEQRAAVLRWQGKDRFYQQVQAALRGETDDDEAIDTADTLLTVVTHPLEGDYTVWRGVRSAESTYGVTSDQLEELIGQHSKLDRFLAASLDQDVAIEEFTEPQLKGGAVLIEVTLKQGVRTAWIAPLGSQEMARQRELLVRPGMMQRIVGVVRTGPLPIVRMEVTPE